MDYDMTLNDIDLHIEWEFFEEPDIEQACVDPLPDQAQQLSFLHNCGSTWGNNADVCVTAF